MCISAPRLAMCPAGPTARGGGGHDEMNALRLTMAKSAISRFTTHSYAAEMIASAFGMHFEPCYCVTAAPARRSLYPVARRDEARLSQ